MSDELRAAAERLGRLAAGEPLDQAYRATPHPATYHRRDLEAVASAYLAEHPADDAEPVTDEWLAELLGHPVRPMIGGGWDELAVSAALRSRGETLWPFVKGRKWVRFPFAGLTRGDVRRLLAALGVEAKGR